MTRVQTCVTVTRTATGLELQRQLYLNAPFGSLPYHRLIQHVFLLSEELEEAFLF